ncbi:MAG: 30S ribosomal protein S21 [Planctomycetota bacterium]|jgi:small subunit ribosomal protein S21
MAEVKIREGESIDNALRRLQRLCRENVAELKKRRHYEKPSDIRRKQRTRRKGQNKGRGIR